MHWKELQIRWTADSPDYRLAGFAGLQIRRIRWIADSLGCRFARVQIRRIADWLILDLILMILILTLNDFDETSKNIKPFEKPSKSLKSIEKDFGFAGLQIRQITY